VRNQHVSNIEVVLAGGFGNQLFQYYAGRLLAKYYEADLSINVFSFSNHIKSDGPQDRSFQLLSLTYLPIQEVTETRLSYYKCKLSKQIPVTRKMFGIVTDETYAAPHYSKKLLLNGYFQFANAIWEMRSQIVQEIQLEYFSESTKLLLTKIPFINQSICIHLRLGDYLTLPDFKVASQDYLGNCLASIQSLSPGLPVFLITDSEKMVIELYSEIIDKYQIRVLETIHVPPWEIIHVLKLFKYLILSKSSLSWWAGFLSTNLGNMVYAPYKSNFVGPGNFRKDQLLLNWEIIPN
jgi:hypothetical protein